MTDYYKDTSKWRQMRWRCHPGPVHPREQAGQALACDPMCQALSLWLWAAADPSHRTRHTAPQGRWRWASCLLGARWGHPNSRHHCWVIPDASLQSSPPRVQEEGWARPSPPPSQSWLLGRAKLPVPVPPQGDAGTRPTSPPPPPQRVPSYWAVTFLL